ncbi:hypothetical protein N7G274_008545 [Stereocaulon virgatum]|uniref:Endonuclease/exonuclease/phosphatase domain-containing protein n=1 Tax=Stereocaulon virgatum TaxID=373712 RepID=A0ABR3ZYL1_9LECA
MPSSSRGLSPPPLKRRRLSPSPSSLPKHQPPPPPLPTLPTPNSPLATPHTSFRIYTWNINGIAPFLPSQTQKITSFLTPTPTTTTKRSPSNPQPHNHARPKPPQPSLRTRLRDWSWPPILLLQEIKLAPTDKTSQSSLLRAINTPLDTEPSSSNQNPNPNPDRTADNRNLYNAHFSLPRDPHNATAFHGKIYGVCTLVRRDIPHVQVKSVDWDLEGRVLVTELPKLGIVVVNIYAVNGTTNGYRDPETGKVVGDRHARKRIFHSLLAEEVRGYEEQGWGVVVAGDMNISRGGVDSFPQLRMGEEHVRNRADFEEKFIRGLGMIDTFRMVRGEERKFTYRPTNKPWGAGGDRVDMVLVTRGLEESVKEADILDSEEDRGPSDHVPLFV